MSQDGTQIGLYYRCAHPASDVDGDEDAEDDCTGTLRVLLPLDNDRATVASAPLAAASPARTRVTRTYGSPRKSHRSSTAASTSKAASASAETGSQVASMIKLFHPTTHTHTYAELQARAKEKEQKRAHYLEEARTLLADLQERLAAAEEASGLPAVEELWSTLRDAKAGLLQGGFKRKRAGTEQEEDGSEGDGEAEEEAEEQQALVQSTSNGTQSRAKKRLRTTEPTSFATPEASGIPKRSAAVATAPTEAEEEDESSEEELDMALDGEQATSQTQQAPAIAQQASKITRAQNAKVSAAPASASSLNESSDEDSDDSAPHVTASRSASAQSSQDAPPISSSSFFGTEAGPPADSADVNEADSSKIGKRRPGVPPAFRKGIPTAEVRLQAELKRQGILLGKLPPGWQYRAPERRGRADDDFFPSKRARSEAASQSEMELEYTPPVADGSFIAPASSAAIASSASSSFGPGTSASVTHPDSSTFATSEIIAGSSQPVKRKGRPRGSTASKSLLMEFEDIQSQPYWRPSSSSRETEAEGKSRPSRPARGSAPKQDHKSRRQSQLTGSRARNSETRSDSEDEEANAADETVPSLQPSAVATAKRRGRPPKLPISAPPASQSDDGAPLQLQNGPYAKVHGIESKNGRPGAMARKNSRPAGTQPTHTQTQEDSEDEDDNADASVANAATGSARSRRASLPDTAMRRTPSSGSNQAQKDEQKTAGGKTPRLTVNGKRVGRPPGSKTKKASRKPREAAPE